MSTNNAKDLAWNTRKHFYMNLFEISKNTNKAVYLPNYGIYFIFDRSTIEESCCFRCGTNYENGYRLAITTVNALRYRSKYPFQK